MTYNFIDIKTNQKLFIPRYQTKVIDGKIVYLVNGKQKGIKKIETDLGIYSIRTETKNR